MVKNATATGPDSLRVELADGRVQEITLSGFAGSGKSVAVTIIERKNGQIVRSETSSPG
jgi:hypothetical protein